MFGAKPFILFVMLIARCSFSASDGVSSIELIKEDRLSSQEEEYAYGAKSPSARVAAFLRIADKKIDLVRRAKKQNPPSSLADVLKGYLAALQGAALSVSWGKELGEDMKRQSESIAKLTRKHFIILGRLSETATDEDRGVILGIQQSLSKTDQFSQVR